MLFLQRIIEMDYNKQGAFYGTAKVHTERKNSQSNDINSPVIMDIIIQTKGSLITADKDTSDTIITTQWSYFSSVWFGLK